MFYSASSALKVRAVEFVKEFNLSFPLSKSKYEYKLHWKQAKKPYKEETMQNCAFFYLQRSENVRLQIAAVYCINNLVWNEDEGAGERRAKLKEYGVQKHLQSLLSSSDTALFDK